MEGMLKTKLNNLIVRRVRLRNRRRPGGRGRTVVWLRYSGRWWGRPVGEGDLWTGWMEKIDCVLCEALHF